MEGSPPAAADGVKIGLGSTVFCLHKTLHRSLNQLPKDPTFDSTRIALSIPWRNSCQLNAQITRIRQRATAEGEFRQRGPHEKTSLINRTYDDSRVRERRRAAAVRPDQADRSAESEPCGTGSFRFSTHLPRYGRFSHHNSHQLPSPKWFHAGGSSRNCIDARGQGRCLREQ